MRFVCESCQTRYLIPDERARGRVLKIRCKKCGNVIILRPGSGEAAEGASPGATREPPREESTQMVDTQALRALRETSRPPAPEPRIASRAEALNDRPLRDDGNEQPAPPKQPPAAAGDEPAIWHAIVAGAQIGPLAMSALIERMLAGSITPRTFVWRDGQGDWKRAAEVPDVARWLPAQPSPPRRSTAEETATTPLPKATPRSKPRKPDKRLASDGPAADAEATVVTNQPTARSTDRPAVAVAESAEFKRAPTPAEIAQAKSERAVAAFFGDAEAQESTPDLPFAAPAPTVPSDPFAQVGDAAGLAQPKPGEVTKFFLTQAGVAKRRSPWRLVAFAVLAAGLLLGGLFGLAQLGVNVPLVGADPGDGEARKVFSGNSEATGLGDLLLGRRRKSPKPAARPSAPASLGTAASSAGAAAGSATDQGPLAKKADPHVEKLGATDVDDLKKLYDKKEPISVKPVAAKVDSPVLDRSDAPLTPDQVAKTVARFQSGYTSCIDRELKRNPNFQGGKIRIVTTIMSSGLVRHAQIESDNPRLAQTVSGGALGSCLTDQTRRMVFPSFSGDPFDAEIPLVVGASL